MKIGLVSDTCYPFPSGVAEYMYNLYRVLRDRGHNAKIITSSFGSDVLRDPNIIRVGKTVLFPFNKAVVTLTFGTDLVSRMKRVLEREAFDILHIVGPVGPTLPLLSLICSKTTTVGTFASYYERSRLLGLARPWMSKYFEKLRGKICISQAARRAITRYFDGEYRIIPAGIDVERFTETSEVLPQFADGKLNVLFVGRLEERKGLVYLLEAYGKARRVVDDLRLIVVGTGPERGKCEELARRIGGEVHFAGRVEFDLLPRYYGSCDIFCSPATGSEAQGIVLLEALASGKPVVASSIEGYDEVITDGVDGLLVPPKDPDTLADAITQLCQNDDLREKMGRRGLQKAREYSWERVGAAVESYYDELLRWSSTR